MAPGPPETVTEHRLWDFAGERHRQHERSLYNGGHDLQFETLHAGGRAYAITTLMRRYTARDASFDEALEGLAPWPGFVVLRALERAESLVWLGSDAGVDRITFEWKEGDRRELSIDRATGRLLRLAWTAPDPVTGERRIEWVYQGRQEVEGFLVPERVERWVNSEVWSSRTVRAFEPDVELPADVFELEADLRPMSPEARVVDVRGPVREIQGLGGGLYTVPFVELEDGVVVYDAVLADALTESAIERIEAETGKPVRYVVLSHHHTDHIRGLRPFVANGAAVVTTRETWVMAERILELKGLNTEPILVEPDAPFVLSEDEPRVVVHNLGATPHVSDLVVLEVETTEGPVVVQADAYFEFGAWGETFEFFFEWLGERGLRDEAVVTGVHHGPLRPGELARRRCERRVYTPHFLSR